MFKVGIGPSSSHTVGPMRAACLFAEQIQAQGKLDQVSYITTELFGSLGQTGKGHGTGKAIILGLIGYSPEDVPVQQIDSLLSKVASTQSLMLLNSKKITFLSKGAIIFHRRKTLPKHANGMTMSAYAENMLLFQCTYYSIGGGFIVEDKNFETQKSEKNGDSQVEVPFPFSNAHELMNACQDNGFRISTLMLKNELVMRSENDIRSNLLGLWNTMQECIENGKRTEGILPGGLKVYRRAPALFSSLENEKSSDPMACMDWVNLFAIAVNEENAAGGRVVTAPTNGAAGIIPAVMSYYHKFVLPMSDDTACRFLLTAAAIGILYKKMLPSQGQKLAAKGKLAWHVPWQQVR
ncbi:L-serine dehydratase 1 [Paraglaciecola psychrophila 170]|uniref:L-serine dehydratase n=1 Tax=Paraglaciecola psychrophila 170 TaxID=1129794 RepID=M4RJ44_9ALTE|nr:L-serine dehydratase 1 [Paraglaciecola psychrophila 170]